MPNVVLFQLFDEKITSEDSPLYQGTFLLAEEAELGNYRITSTGKGSATCEFAVEEYVLPKFGVEIEGIVS